MRDNFVNKRNFSQRGFRKGYITQYPPNGRRIDYKEQTKTGNISRSSTEIKIMVTIAILEITELQVERIVQVTIIGFYMEDSIMSTTEGTLKRVNMTIEMSKM